MKVQLTMYRILSRFALKQEHTIKLVYRVISRVCYLIWLRLSPIQMIKQYGKITIHLSKLQYMFLIACVNARAHG